MTIIPVMATGLSGLVGTRVQDLLSHKYSFTDLSLATGVDITDIDAVDANIKNSPAGIILHMAAKTDVDSCEDDKIFLEEGNAWRINVTGTENIIAAGRKYSKKVIYISTDFVFDGVKGNYSEEDNPNPVNWYGVTKYEAEKKLLEANIDFSILRIAYPYRAEFGQKQDFVRRIISTLQDKKEIPALTDHVITPTFIDDIAFALDTFLVKNLTGIYHVVGNQNLSVNTAAKIINREFFNTSLTITPVLRTEYFKNRAYRPLNLSLKNDKIAKLGIKMNSFTQGLRKMHTQMKELNIQ